tara:strand:+ start:225 stop:374 length:150 start_codon:yes stop_codon:yes gene_type:complete
MVIFINNSPDIRTEARPAPNQIFLGKKRSSLEISSKTPNPILHQGSILT